MSELAAAYWRYERSIGQRLFWAWEEVNAEGWHDAEAKWPQILALLGAALTSGKSV
jgi:hypothetical protein